MASNMDKIIIRGARVHNLKNINIEIPRNKFVVFTGLSGSGKSSLVFDTIFAEGQRRYMESLSSYARQFLDVLQKPDVDQIEGLPPTIAVDQKSAARNPRSTVGTMTEIYDYLRLLFARAGSMHCPKCGKRLEKQTITQMINTIIALPERSSLMLLSPAVHDEKGEHRHVLSEARKAKIGKLRVDGRMVTLQEYGFLDLDPKKSHSIDFCIGEFSIDFSDEHLVEHLNLRALIKTALEHGRGRVILFFPEENRELVLSESFCCVDCGVIMEDLEPRSFSFNSPHGACQKCGGLGVSQVIDVGRLIPNPDLSLDEGVIQPWFKVVVAQKEWYRNMLAVFKKAGISTKTLWSKFSSAQKEYILYGKKKEKKEGEESPFSGIATFLEELYRKTSSEYIKSELEDYLSTEECRACHGHRLKPEYLAVTVGGMNISQYVECDIETLRSSFSEIFSASARKASKTPQKEKKENGDSSVEKLNAQELKIAEPIIREIVSRIGYLIEVGLGYLTLGRSSVTLAGGEAQRIRLASLISSHLVGVGYILDEPSIGLHPRDNQKLINLLKEMRDQGNSLLVVEHDEATMRQADYLVDVGPDAGEYGGEIIAAGTPQEVIAVKNSITGQYLSGKLSIPAPEKYRKGSGKHLEIQKAAEHNLKSIDAKIPLGKFICVTGVSGSGKSTLVIDVLAKALAKKFYRAKEVPGAHKAIFGIEHIDKMIHIDQSPIGRTPRSNPATYTNLFNYIRDLFSQIPEAKLKGFSAGHFSFNKEGRCEACAGEGHVKIDMQFLEDIYVQCQECHGKRYNQRSLDIYYQGKNIADILEMTVSEAMWFFNAQVVPMIYEKLYLLKEVGLGYIRLGQPATTLSGGEAQRIKLAAELSRRSTGKTLYILDEPTTGLHFEDIKKLLLVLNKLADKGNTVLVVEHNLDMMKSADWIIDLGPEGGKDGGEIVAQGTPQDVAKIKSSHTGQFLKTVLE